MRRLRKSEWTFEDEGGVSVCAAINHDAKTYSVSPGAQSLDGLFMFKNQRLPHSKTPRVARLLVEASDFCEAQLGGREAVHDESCLEHALKRMWDHGGKEEKP